MKYILRIDDVGRLPSDPPEAGTDSGLDWFRKWFDDSSLRGVPAVCGVTPAWLDQRALRWLPRMARDHKTIFALHGWNHERDIVVTKLLMQLGVKALGKTNAYIPPFNEYGAKTIWDWSEIVENPVFFGGFNEEHHFFGIEPFVYSNWVHYPAYHDLYGTSLEIIKRLPQNEFNYPLTITLHVPWEIEVKHTASLIERIKQDIVPPPSAKDLAWLSKKTI